MVVSSTDGKLVAMSQPDNLESEAMHHLPLPHYGKGGGVPGDVPA